MWIRKNLVTVDIFYYVPDYSSLIQEFVWQTEDLVPELPRVHRFLNYWKDEVEAVIKEVNVRYTDSVNMRYVSIYREIN
jgi:uncharacterized protein Usg